MKKTVLFFFLLCFTLFQIMCKHNPSIISDKEADSLDKQDSICFFDIQNKSWEMVWTSNPIIANDSLQVLFLEKSGVFTTSSASYSCSAIYHYNESIKTIHFKCNEKERFMYQVMYCSPDSLRIKIYSGDDIKRERPEVCSFVLKN